MDLHTYVPACLQELCHVPLETALCIPFAASNLMRKIHNYRECL